MTYFDLPLQRMSPPSPPIPILISISAVIDQWKKQGGETWQLIEPVDGYVSFFHLSLFLYLSLAIYLYLSISISSPPTPRPPKSMYCLYSSCILSLPYLASIRIKSRTSCLPVTKRRCTKRATHTSCRQSISITPASNSCLATKVSFPLRRLYVRRLTNL